MSEDKVKLAPSSSSEEAETFEFTLFGKPCALSIANLCDNSDNYLRFDKDKDGELASLSPSPTLPLSPSYPLSLSLRP